MKHITKEKPLPQIDFGPLPPGLTTRQAAEEEAARDLLKHPEQLLADVHDEILQSNRPIDQNLIHAQKRIASIMVRVAASNEAATKVMVKLNKWLLVLTVVVVILTIVLLFR
ncbi:MAG: hypothetical protein O2960_25110 [Verrucomicrobia bacterium]|nr:hypothetical protein [Verrucomicrobiota bacterium]